MTILKILNSISNGRKSPRKNCTDSLKIFINCDKICKHLNAEVGTFHRLRHKFNFTRKLIMNIFVFLQELTGLHHLDKFQNKIFSLAE